MKRKLILLSLLTTCASALTACQYNFKYDIPVYPVVDPEDDPTRIILPKNIFLSNTKKQVLIGNTVNLYATVSPTNTTDKSLIWSSENNNIASVSQNGEVTGISEGRVIVSAKSNADNNIVASCEITVDPEVIHITEFDLSSTIENIKVGNTAMIYPIISPADATNKKVIWTSSDESILTVNDGLITGVAPGEALVTAATEDSNLVQTCKVTVRPRTSQDDVLPESITLDVTSKTVSAGSNFQLVPTIGPDDVDDRTVTWKSSNSTVASVSPSGVVSANSEGTAVITVTANANTSVTATCTVLVTEKQISVKSVILSEGSKSLEVGQTFGLTATVLPDNASNKNVSWESDKPSVATVTNGVVTAVSAGNAIITVVTEDGNKKASCSISVKSQGTSDDPGFEDTGVDDEGTYDLKIWCDERISSSMSNQVNSFVQAMKQRGKNYTINLKIDEVSEGDAATMMTQDVGSGADLYVFAQDQLAKLKTAGALTAITGDIGKAVKAETETDGIGAASINDKMYAYPFTSDNGYFLYYDKKFVSDEDAKDIEKIIADCEANDLKINYSIFGNGFYSASYFMATGCQSIWDMDATNNFTAYHDNYNSENGFIAAKGIQYLAAHNIFANSDDPSKFGRAKGGIGACVSGIWNYQYALNALGADRLGCAEMPYFTVDGTRHHISSFSGYKLLGVKPQTDKKRVSVCKRLARYLSCEICQVERFESVGWGPTNINALGKDNVKNHPGLKALRAQQPYSKPQVQCPSSWYGSVSSLAAAIKFNSTDADIRAQLQLYEENLESLLTD